LKIDKWNTERFAAPAVLPSKKTGSLAVNDGAGRG
jgi:hypothetical protein